MKEGKGRVVVNCIQREGGEGKRRVIYRGGGKIGGGGDCRCDGMLYIFQCIV